jgi:peptide subunit release factor 1 (eRF1)
MQLDNLTDRLAAFEPTEFPFISLYLNTLPNENGRENYDPFVRKQFEELSKTFAPRSVARDSFERDATRIRNYLENELDKAANGVAIFACAGADFFEAVQLDAPIERHRLSVSDHPDLYPLARLMDQYPAYAALLVDTNAARIFVFSLGRRVGETEINSPKTNRSQVGGWSQARYQRHTENIHLHHVKEVVETLERIVREEKIEHVILAGDEVIIPTLREQLPTHLNEKVVDVLRLDIKTPEHEVLRATLERLREQDAEEDAAKVQRLIDEYRAGGLAVAGVEKTRAALEIGQVDELIISAQRSAITGKPAQDKGVLRPAQTPAIAATAVASGTPEVAAKAVAIGDELVRQARLTAAKLTFIEDPALLAEFGGVGALLRFKL